MSKTNDIEYAAGKRLGGMAAKSLYKRIPALKHLDRAVSASDFANRHAVAASKAYDAGSSLLRHADGASIPSGLGAVLSRGARSLAQAGAKVVAPVARAVGSVGEAAFDRLGEMALSRMNIGLPAANADGSFPEMDLRGIPGVLDKGYEALKEHPDLARGFKAGAWDRFQTDLGDTKNKVGSVYSDLKSAMNRWAYGNEEGVNEALMSFQGGVDPGAQAELDENRQGRQVLSERSRTTSEAVRQRQADRAMRYSSRGEGQMSYLGLSAHPGVTDEATRLLPTPPLSASSSSSATSFFDEVPRTADPTPFRSITRASSVTPGSVPVTGLRGISSAVSQSVFGDAAVGLATGEPKAPSSLFRPAPPAPGESHQHGSGGYIEMQDPPPRLSTPANLTPERMRLQQLTGNASSNFGVPGVPSVRYRPGSDVDQMRGIYQATQNFQSPEETPLLNVTDDSLSSSMSNNRTASSSSSSSSSSDSVRTPPASTSTSTFNAAGGSGPSSTQPGKNSYSTQGIGFSGGGGSGAGAASSPSLYSPLGVGSGGGGGSPHNYGRVPSPSTTAQVPVGGGKLSGMLPNGNQISIGRDLNATVTPSAANQGMSTGYMGMMAIGQALGIVQGAFGMANQDKATENAAEMQAWQNNEQKLMQGRQMSHAVDQERQSFANMVINARQRYRW